MDYVSLVDFGSLAVAVIAASAAIAAAASARSSYRLSQSIYDEIKSDEMIVAGRLHRPEPEISHNDHAKCVLRCGLYNRSKRKVYVHSVEAYDQDGQRFNITWSGSVDKVGAIQKPTGLLGIEDSAELYIRSNDGAEFKESTKILILHSFSEQPIELTFDPYQEWW